jgi:hypothetical protein
MRIARCRLGLYSPRSRYPTRLVVDPEGLGQLGGGHPLLGTEQGDPVVEIARVAVGPGVLTAHGPTAGLLPRRLHLRPGLAARHPPQHPGATSRPEDRPGEQHQHSRARCATSRPARPRRRVRAGTPSAYRADQYVGKTCATTCTHPHIACTGRRPRDRGEHEDRQHPPRADLLRARPTEPRIMPERQRREQPSSQDPGERRQPAAPRAMTPSKSRKLGTRTTSSRAARLSEW